MSEKSPKKVLFLITESNWDEVRDGTRTARLIENFYKQSAVKGPMSGQRL